MRRIAHHSPLSPSIVTLAIGLYPGATRWFRAQADNLTMSVTLHFPKGSYLTLEAGQKRYLGRQDVLDCPEAMFVSRKQCEVEVVPGHGSAPPKVKLTTTNAANPTWISQQGSNAAQLLSSGFSATLGDGDKFSLIATRPDHAIRVSVDATSQHGQHAPQPPLQQGNTAAAGPASQTDVPPNTSSKPSSDAAIHQTRATTSLANNTHSIEPDGPGTPFSASNDKPLAPCPPVMVILVGPPGSGKSTFSQHLLACSLVRWVHINQDTVKCGKPGRRDQCVRAARRALAGGASVIIDRTNFDISQRQDFLELAHSMSIKVYGVLLSLPLGLCLERVEHRTGHPGGVQGQAAKRIVHTMNSQIKKAGPPQLAEGFEAIMECRNEADVAACLDAWSHWGTFTTNTDTAATATAVPTTVPAASAQPPGAAHVAVQPEAAASAVQPTDAAVTTGTGAAPAAYRGTALPASTAAAHATATLQSEVAAGQPVSAADQKLADPVEVWQRLVSRRPSSHGAQIQRFFQPTSAKSTARPHAATGSTRGTGTHADMSGAGRAPYGPPHQRHPMPTSTGPMSTQLQPSQQGEQKTSANTTYDGIGHPSHDSCQPPQTATRNAAYPHKRLASAASGSLPSPPPAKKEHLSGDSQPPTCDMSDTASLAKAAATLAITAGQAHQLTHHQPAPHSQVSQPHLAPQQPMMPTGTLANSNAAQQPNSSHSPSLQPQPQKNAFAALMSAAHHTAAKSGSQTFNPGSKSHRPHAVPHQGSQPSSSGSGSSPPAVSKFKFHGAWAQALRDIALHPERHTKSAIEVHDDCVLAVDAYPKARHHALVIARDAGLESLLDLRVEHISLLEHMQEVGLAWAEKQKAQDPSHPDFLLGFHSVPSMRQLHMHVVSQDLDSPSLKHKKHWNSFTTPFFLPVEHVINQLSTSGHVTVDIEAAEQLLKQDMKCHMCGKFLKNMPELKAHIPCINKI